MSAITIPTMAEMVSKGERPEILFWVGCAGSFDERAQRITKAFAKLLHHAEVSFAVLGTEESCTGDPAKRSGNEFLYQMQAMMNIQVLNGYEVSKIVTTCPHCFNTLKNEYPSLGGNYQVMHHTQLLNNLIDEGRISVSGGSYKGKRITYHDPCYLGRANKVYEAPRELINKLDAVLVEMKNCKNKALCCGAGGAQMFKEPEAGKQDINIRRTDEAIDTATDTIVTGCPFCNTMLTDGVTHRQKDMAIRDIAEIIAKAIDL